MTQSMSTIRRIKKGEWELFKQVRLAALKEAPYAFGSTYEGALERSTQRWVDQADGSAEGEMRATFLAFSGDCPVGITALYRNANRVNEGEVLQVWVAPDARATGLAQRLVETTLAWAEKQGVETVLATISKSNLGAVAFYEKCGFVLVDEQSRDGDSDLVYEKKL